MLRFNFRDNLLLKIIVIIIVYIFLFKIVTYLGNYLFGKGNGVFFTLTIMIILLLLFKSKKIL